MKRASNICYARVSTYGQMLDAQLEQLRGAGCTKIYREKVTGAHSDRQRAGRSCTPHGQAAPTEPRGDTA